jgi:endonuclease/exonuclease/phosphatase family metal-dependent hydrolase
LARPARRWAAGVVLLSGLLGLACSPLNYLDSSGPFRETRFAPGVPTGSNPEARLRVASFNIAYAVEIDRALEVLEQSPPLLRLDVLALQEMDAPGTERIARALELNSLYVPSAVHPRSGRDFGCAILSPWPLVEPGKVVLPIAGLGSGVRRSAARATVLWGRRRVRVYSLHLPSPLGVTGAARRQQIEVLLADAADSSDPVVVAGDFNSGDVGKQLVRSGFGWPTRDVGTTSKFLFFGMSIDHIFGRGLSVPTDAPAAGVVEDNRGASDHRPVWAVFEPPPPAR